MYPLVPTIFLMIDNAEDLMFMTLGFPVVDEADYLGDFGVGHDGGDGEGEFLGVDLFGDWE